MRYPVAIEPATKNSVYGVAVPDLPGCFSAGDTWDEAITNAEEAILLHLEALIDQGEAPPEPTRPNVNQKAYKGWMWALVDVDLAKLSDKAIRVNITVPERLLGSIDKYAKRQGESRSAFLVRAATEAMVK